MDPSAPVFTPGGGMYGAGMGQMDPHMMQQMGMTPQMMQQMGMQQQMMQMQMQMGHGMGQPMGMMPPAQMQAPQQAPQQAAAPTPPAVSSHPDAQTLGVFLEEIAFFLEDMERDLWWLLRAAHQPKPLPIVTGGEELEPVEPDTEAIIEQLRVRADIHAEQHAQQVRAKIVIIPGVVPAEKKVLVALRGLKFHCKGRVEVFQCMKEANNSAIWAAYHNYVSSIEPQWVVKSDGAISKPYFAQCVVLVPVYADLAKREIKLFNVWCPEKKKRHWSFPGGDILRGVDRNLYDTVRREFHEEVGIFFGRSWSDCFVAELPNDMATPLDHPSMCIFNQFEKDGVRYPVRPYIFVQVKEDFYATSRCYEKDPNGVIKLPDPEGDIVRFDDLVSARNVHLHGHPFIEHDEARWVTLEYSTGKMLGDDGRQLRKEYVEFFRTMPEKVWDYFARLGNLDPVVRSSVLPSGFPTDGPFSVRMSGIDKTASDADIKQYFEDNNIEVKNVEQYEEPRHTARVDFHDVHSLEQAIQLSGRNLLRRKVKVELWGDAGATSAAPVAIGVATPKPYEGPLPDAPPFKIIIRSLDKSVDRDDLGYFFWDRKCEVIDIDYPLKTERHAGIVEFKDTDSLRQALSLSHTLYKGREVLIDLYTGNEKARSGGGGGGGGKGRKGGGKGDGHFGRDRDREPPSRAEFGSERPRLELKPRTKPLPGEPGYREEASRASGGRSDPFGGARPREDRFKPTRADGDDNWRR